MLLIDASIKLDPLRWCRPEPIERLRFNAASRLLAPALRDQAGLRTLRWLRLSGVTASRRGNLIQPPRDTRIAAALNSGAATS